MPIAPPCGLEPFLGINGLRYHRNRCQEKRLPGAVSRRSAPASATRRTAPDRRPREDDHETLADPRRPGDGCLLAGASLPAAGKARAAPVIALSNVYYGDIFRHQMVESFSAAATEAKRRGNISDFVVLNGDGSVNQQIAQFSDLGLRHVDVIAVDAASDTALNASWPRPVLRASRFWRSTPCSVRHAPTSSTSISPATRAG